MVFCSKDFRPILPYIKDITERFHTYFHYTITAYGKDVEPGVPSIDQSMNTLVRLSEIVGKEQTKAHRKPGAIISYTTRILPIGGKYNGE